MLIDNSALLRGIFVATPILFSFASKTSAPAFTDCENAIKFDYHFSKTGKWKGLSITQAKIKATAVSET
jgi:hypothetical protein